MSINYRQKIKESVSRLKALERQHQGRATGDRIQMSRLLKTVRRRHRRASAQKQGAFEKTSRHG